MPTTVNGIGTSYVGKKNLSKRNGTCSHCHKATVLSSYDTRLCVVVVFIPIIPLGRKRVIDECGRCRRHHVMPLENYHQARDESLVELEQASSRNPGDVKAAVAYNSALFQFHQTERGLGHLAEIAGRFSGDADLQLYAGGVCEREGRMEEANRYFDRAFEIDPRHPGARRARVMTLIEAGRLHEAKSLHETTDAEHRDPSVTFMLAQAYQRERDPQTALAIYRQLVAEHPAVARQKAVRKAVKSAEREARAGSSMLPSRELPWKALSTVALVVAAVLTGIWGLETYFRHHYRLHVVNGFPGETHLRIDGEQELVFPEPGRQEIELSEGAHQAEVTSPWQETLDFELRRDFWQRLTGDAPTTVLNPGGLAVLVVEDTLYSDREAEFEPTYRPSAQSFQTFAGVDYPFREFPEQISLPSGTHQLRKTRLVEVTVDPEDAYWVFLDPNHAGKGLDYLERWIDLTPRDSLLGPYAAVAAAAGANDRAAEFLGERLTVDPVNVQWHRMVQEIMGRESDELTARYDALLAADPANPDLLYLRGRIDPRGGSAYFDRALEIDPGHRYTRQAQAYDAMSRADFAAAAAQYAGLLADGHADFEIEGPYQEALFASGQWSTLEPRLRAGLEDPDNVDWGRAALLVQSLVARGRVEEAGELVRQISEQERAQLEGEVFMSPWLQAQLFYATGRWDDLQRTVEGADFPFQWKDAGTLWWITESGDFRRAWEVAQNPHDKLLMSLALVRHGRAEQAAAALQEILPAFAEMDPIYRRFAGMLTGEIPVTRENVDLLSGPSDLKAVLLTALAVHQSEQRDFLLREARKHNFRLGFPHHLLASFQS